MVVYSKRFPGDGGKHSTRGLMDERARGGGLAERLKSRRESIYNWEIVFNFCGMMPLIE